MKRTTEKLRTILLALFTIVFLSQYSSAVFAAKKNQPKEKIEKASVEDFVVAEKKDEVEEAPENGQAVAPMKAEDSEAETEKEETGKKTSKKTSEDEDDEEEDEDDEERELTPEEIAAREAAEAAHKAEIEKLIKTLEKKVNELGDNNAAIKDLFEDENSREARSESAILLESYLKAILADKKPNYNEIGRIGRELCSKKSDSSLGFYAQGLEAMNSRKPNLSKAMKFLSKAKSLPNPYKDASSAYTSCLIKSYGLYVVIVVGGLIGGLVFIIIKKKKQKALETVETNSEETLGEDNANAEFLQSLIDNQSSVENKTEVNEVNNNIQPESSDILNSKSEKSDEIVPQNPLESEITKSSVGVESQAVTSTESVTSDFSPENSSADIKSKDSFASSGNEASQYIPGLAPEVEGAYNPFARNVAAKPQIKENKEIDESPKTSDVVHDSIVNSVSAPKSSSEQPPSAPAKKVVRVVKKVRVRKDADGNSYVVSESSQPAATSSYQTNAQIEAELEGIRGISRLNSKPVPPIDSQIDALWSNLSRKAMQGHIGLMARKADSLSSSLPAGNIGDTGNTSSFYSNDSKYNDFRIGDVSIDLSEEALKDDLIGKLKMLAITDSELRELFAMKNPAHIPHLIEYVMTKPEPMRLAFVTKELGNYNDPAIIDTLSTLLYHEDERVVLAAIQGLEATKSPSAVVPLCPFLRSEIPLFAQAARTALGKFGAVKIMQALKDLPSFTDIKLKEAGVFVLSRMKGEPVEKILKNMLNDDSPSVRIQVILAMSFQKNPVYIDTLREFYRIANDSEKSMTRKAIVYLNGFNK